MSDAKRTSGCICGAVRVEILGEPVAMVYCHCESCRRWLSAPIHAASLWPTPNVEIVEGQDRIAVWQRTEASLRHFCTSCGAGVLIRHPAIGMTDVPAGTIGEFGFEPTLHVHYGEKVLQVRDGLPKYKDFPSDFGGSGDTLPE